MVGTVKSSLTEDALRRRLCICVWLTATIHVTCQSVCVKQPLAFFSPLTVSVSVLCRHLQMNTLAQVYRQRKRGDQAKPSWWKPNLWETPPSNVYKKTLLDLLFCLHLLLIKPHACKYCWFMSKRQNMKYEMKITLSRSVSLILNPILHSVPAMVCILIFFIKHQNNNNESLT